MYEAHPVSQSVLYGSRELKGREAAMARSRIQFQKGCSLTHLMDEHATEEER